MINKHYLMLIGIVAVACILRFYLLGVNPPSLTWDEVAWGYNAYTLGLDGRDEFGRLLPFDYLESFGDFKPPLYAYLAIIPVKLFGLTEFAVRIPSAFFGVLSVLVTFFLAREIFEDKKERTNRATEIALIAAGLLAVSPWHINLSRAAFEANVASFFLMTGVFLFVKWTRSAERGYLLVSAGLMFVLSLYTFNTSRIVAPILVLILSIGFWKTLLNHKILVAVAATVCIVVSIPFLRFAVTPQAQLRYHEVNIFSDVGIIERSNQAMGQSLEAWGGATPFYANIVHNRRVYYAIAFLKHYFDHFNPSFLFIRGDGNPKFSTQDVGQLYIVSLPFLVSGMLVLLTKRAGYWWIVPLWLLVGILPAATARETPHALRIETTLPTWHILTALGIVWVMGVVRQRVGNRGYKIAASVLVVLYGFNILYYLHGYYVHYPREYSGEWQYGYREALSYIINHPEYQTVVMTESLGRPYAYTLFYERTDPAIFRETAQIEREAMGFVHVYGFGRYVFSDTPSQVSVSGKTLIVDVPGNIPEGASIQATFKQLDGKIALIAYEK